jgi:hypothetical protein
MFTPLRKPGDRAQSGDLPVVNRALWQSQTDHMGFLAKEALR